MKILFISQAAWDNKNSFGNTVSNWFEGKEWEKDSFIHFYTRKNKPDNNLIINYYNLSVIDILKGILKLNIKGKEFSINEIKEESKEEVIEKKRIAQLHRSKRNNFIYFIYELIWGSSIWFNKSFKRFLIKNSPDVLFAFATNQYILWPIIKYLKKNTKCKIVLFIADDVYGSIEHTVYYRKFYLKKLFENCLLNADKLYAVSEEMAELYSKRFKKNVEVLYKGCDLSLKEKKILGNPIKIVYAGNLLWGRENILHQVALELEKINKERTKIILEIYTGATITRELEKKLNIGVSSKIMGSRPYNKIKEIMNNSDIVLHVESFEEESKKLVKYSLSTKIIDCLQSGVQVMGIGPSEVSSIKYLKKIDGTIVIENIEKLPNVLKIILDNKEKIIKNIELTRNYAEKHHEISKVRKKLKGDLINLIKKR